MDTELPKQLQQGNRRALAKAITLIESRLDKHREQAQTMLEQLLPFTGNSLRIGISGSPGVGKSTFIEALGLHLIAEGKKVAVLAVDPSSPVAGGSILGDKTRMEKLSRETNAYIRPSPASGELGGVAQKTREALLLCEAAGFDVVLIETVGVGQSEYDVAGMVDFFLVLIQPNAGDELQGIKKGIMELADALVINKADGDSEHFANQAKNHIQNALQLMTSSDFWIPQVLTCSSLFNKNITAVWQIIQRYVEQSRANGYFQKKRDQQAVAWMNKLLMDIIQRKLRASEDYLQMHESVKAAVAKGTMTPLDGAQKIANSVLMAPLINPR